MHRNMLFVYAAAMGALAWAACGSDVESDPGVGGSGAGASANVDQKCYDACITKGETAASCTSYCTVDQQCYDACVGKGETPEVCEAYCVGGGVGGKDSSSSGMAGGGFGGGFGGKYSSSSGTAGEGSK